MNVSPLQRRFIIKQRIYSISVVLSRLILFLGFIGIWEYTADKGIINAFIFSSPVRLYQTFIDLSRDGVIFMHIWVTLYETLVAFAIITIVGIIFAILLWCFKGLSDCLNLSWLFLTASLNQHWLQCLLCGSELIQKR